MKREEPASRLVNTLVDEIGGERLVLVNGITIFKWVMNLCIGHRTRVEPHINEVCLTLHRLTGSTNKNDIVYIRAVEIYLIIIFLRHISRNETFVLQGI